MKIEREMVELLADMANDGCATPVPAPQLAELCRTWLAVQDAPGADIAMYRSESGASIFLTGANPGELFGMVGKRVRLVRDGGE